MINDDKLCNQFICNQFISTFACHKHISSVLLPVVELSQLLDNQT